MGMYGRPWQVHFRVWVVYGQPGQLRVTLGRPGTAGQLRVPLGRPGTTGQLRVPLGRPGTTGHRWLHQK
eukprot:269202-Chlamydomonas_euryale.AAC.2